MTPLTSTAIASPNIAFIKYWGNRDETLRLPANGSISMTLLGLETVATVTFDAALCADELILDGKPAHQAAAMRVSHHLDLVRDLAGIHTSARVESRSNFPQGVGLASSAAAFAALTLAACAAAELKLTPTALSRLARRGSGSACRSIFGGYVEWHAGDDDESSFAEPIAPSEHWDLVDLIAVVRREPKAVGSSAGHAIAETSALQPARVADAPRRLAECRRAILARDFGRLAALSELDSNMMHAVMITSTPSLLYWTPETLEVMQAVVMARHAGLQVFYTIDAGPNVHCLCLPDHMEAIRARLQEVPGVLEIIRSGPGEHARIL